MNAEYAFVLWVSAIVSAAVGFAAWRRRSSPGATGLLLLMAACFEWSSTYAMALASTDPVEQEMLLLLTHLGSVIIPAAALLIALEFARREVVVARPAVWLLLVMPVITLAIVATDSRHGLYFGSDGISAHVVTGGPWLWVDILYSYALIGSAIILIAMAMLKSHGSRRTQAVLILVAFSIPALIDLMAYAGVSVLPGIDATPIAFAVSGAILGYGLFRHQLFEALPLARSKVVDELRSGVIVLDPLGRVVDINPVGQTYSGMRSTVVGMPVNEAFPQWPDELEGLREGAVSIEVVTKDDPPRILEMSLSAVQSDTNEHLASILLIRDYTEERNAQRMEHEALLKFDSLFQANPAAMAVSNADNRFTDVNRAFLRLLGYSREEIIGKTPLDLDMFLEPEEQQSVASRLAQTGCISDVALTLKGKGGTLIDGLFSGELVSLEGEPHLLTVMVDMTERMAAERALAQSERTLARVLEGAALGAWDWDLVTDEVTFNDRWFDMLGYGPTELEQVLSTWQTLVHPEDLDGALAAIRNHIDGETSRYESTHRLRSKTGEWRWILDRGMVVSRDDDERPVRMSGTHLDVTEQIETQQALARGEQLVAGISVATHELLADEELTHEHVCNALKIIGNTIEVDRVYVFEHETDPDSRGFCSQRYEWSSEEAEPQIDNPDLQHLRWDEVAPRWYDTFMAGGVISGNVADFPAEERAVLEPQSVLSLLVLPIWSSGEFWGFVGFDACTSTRSWETNEIAVLEAVASSLGAAISRQHLVITDALTGVLNRHGLDQLAPKELAQARRKGTPLCVAMLDIDCFKGINDHFGHAAGDEVLKAVAQCCLAQLRPRDSVARFGGDEVVLLFPETDAEGARVACERIRQSVADDSTCSGVRREAVPVTVSIGIAEGVGEGLDLDVLLSRADRALYASKSSGRDCVSVG